MRRSCVVRRASQLADSKIDGEQSRALQVDPCVHIDSLPVHSKTNSIFHSPSSKVLHLRGIEAVKQTQTLGKSLTTCSHRREGHYAAECSSVRLRS